MTQMTIHTYGRTAQATVTDAKIRQTQRDIEAVRRNVRRLPDPTCTWAEATEIAASVAGAMTLDRINVRALKLRDRCWRAQIRLAR